MSRHTRDGFDGLIDDNVAGIDGELSPAVRRLLVTGARLGAHQAKRPAFIVGMVCGFLVGLLIGAVIALYFVRLGALEGRP